MTAAKARDARPAERPVMVATPPHGASDLGLRRSPRRRHDGAVTVTRLRRVPAAQAPQWADARVWWGGLRWPILPALIAAAWLLVLVSEATGAGALTHQHGLPAVTATPPLIAVVAFLLSWQVMIAATMLPASLPSMRVVGGIGGGIARPGRGTTVFLAGFVAAWTAFGLVAFAGDAGLRAAISASPWLAARPWLVEAAIVVLAGTYQLSPLKRRSLSACRHRGRRAASRPAGATPLRLGLEHGLACIGSSWALMLVMVAAGFADLWSMAALTAVMLYESTGRHGQRAAIWVGVALLWLAAIIVLPGWLPA